jgi:transposase InsO family protein
VTETYVVIAELQSEFPLSALCATLRVSCSGYYVHQRGAPGPRRREDDRLKPLVRKIFREHKRRYGARRIAEELAARKKLCGPGRVARLMREMKLKAIQPKSFRPRTTDSRHTLGYSPNLLRDAAPTTTINQIWVGDITYVPLTQHDFVYLAMLMDLYSRRIVGWQLSDSLQEPLVLAALRKAISARQPGVGLIHHTDRGGQYAARKYCSMLSRAAMQPSMSRAADCYDNAFMESCFGTVKTELEMESYENETIARKEIGDYIRYYNTRRRHSSLGYLTPVAFEATQK